MLLGVTANVAVGTGFVAVDTVTVALATAGLVLAAPVQVNV
jgi:hypothetical protein